MWDLPIAAKDSLPPEVKQFTIEVGGANTLYLNMDPAGKAGTKFADPKVRQAMSLAINRKAIADTAFAGLVKPLTSFWYDCPDICPTGMLPNGGVQDVEAAKKLMTEAGVPAEGISAEMLVVSTRGGWKEGATLVAADLEAIGVHLTVTPVDEATWNGAVANDNFEAIYNGGAIEPADHDEQLVRERLLGHPLRLHQGPRSRQGRRAHRPDGAGDSTSPSART